MSQIEREEAYLFDPADVVVLAEHFDEALDTLQDLLDRWTDGKIEISADEVAQLKEYVEASRAEDAD